MSEQNPISPIRVQESVQAVEEQLRKKREKRRKMALAIGGSLPLLIIAAQLIIFVALNRWSGENKRLWNTFQSHVAEYDCCHRGGHEACSTGIQALTTLQARLSQEPTMMQCIAEQVSPWLSPGGFFAGPEFDRNQIEALVKKCARTSGAAD